MRNLKWNLISSKMNPYWLHNTFGIMKCILIAYFTKKRHEILRWVCKTFRFVPRWNGACTRDGKTGLCAPSRGGLDLIELKRGTSVQQLISRSAEGVFSIITMFSSTDQYVFYYHSGRKTLRVFRLVKFRFCCGFGYVIYLF